MKKLFKFLLVITVIALIGFAMVFTACKPDTEGPDSGYTDDEKPGDETDDDKPGDETDDDKPGDETDDDDPFEEGGDEYVCFHMCPTCGGCTDYSSTDPACSRKCECPDTEKTYKQEAEGVCSNGNTLFGGNGALTLQHDQVQEGFSNGYQVEGMKNIKTEAGIYFKWDITSSQETIATLSVFCAGTAGEVPWADKFRMEVNEKDVPLTGSFNCVSYQDRHEEKIVDVPLVVGQNYVYIYILTGDYVINFDYFTWISTSVLTFNPATIDTEGMVEGTSQRTEAEDVALNGLGKKLNPSSDGERIEGFDKVTPADGYYFKWDITSSEEAETALSFYCEGIAGTVKNSDLFVLRLNDEYVDITTYGTYSSWNRHTEQLTTFTLKEGENVLYLYLLGSGTDNSINFDYFEFTTVAELTFNECTADPASDPAFPVTIIQAEETETNGYTNDILTLTSNGYVSTAKATTEDGIYFKWTINAEQACDVVLSIYAVSSAKVDLAQKFSVTLNDKPVTVSGTAEWEMGAVLRQDIAVLSLDKGENVLYLNLCTLADVTVDVDYFTFTFNDDITIDTDVELPEHSGIEYRQEAEMSALNGINGGKLSISGDGQRVEGLDMVSAADGYYFKWSITSSKEAEVALMLVCESIAGENVANADMFILRVNDEFVTIDTHGNYTSWTMHSEDIASFTLDEGENTIYLYLLGAPNALNIDYFTFKTDATLTFEPCTADPATDPAFPEFTLADKTEGRDLAMA